MATIDVRTYFKARMSALGYNQWTDPMSIENIPNHIIDTVYHMRNDSGTKVVHNHTDYVYEVPVEIVVFKKGYRDVEVGYEDAIIAHDLIVKECCKASNSKTQPNIKDVEPSNFLLEAIAINNDNIIKLTINFTVTLILDLNV